MASLLKKQINIFECILKRERERGSWLRGSFSFLFTRQTIFFKNSLASSNMPTKFLFNSNTHLFVLYISLLNPLLFHISLEAFSLSSIPCYQRDQYIWIAHHKIENPTPKKPKRKRLWSPAVSNEIYTLVWNHQPPSLPIFYQGLKNKNKNKNKNKKLAIKHPQLFSSISLNRLFAAFIARVIYINPGILLYGGWNP